MSMRRLFLTKHRVFPFFGLSMGISVFSVSLLVVLPFLMMALTGMQMQFKDILNTITEPNVLHAIYLSLGAALAATVTNVIFGVLCAWCLVRYEFWGRRFFNALVDLPFALPTAVTGIALATLYAPQGLFGQIFARFEIQVAFAPLGIYLALVVVSFPFIVRAVAPVLSELSVVYEEAAAVMGASRLSIFWHVILPQIAPSVLTGTGMMFARATGEYGSVIFIAGNVPMYSEILPLIIVSKLELFDVAGASVVALFMLCISLVILCLVNVIQWRLSARLGVH